MEERLFKWLRQVVLGPQIIPQLFYHNSDVTDCEWLTIIYTWTHHFLFTNHTLSRHSCSRSYKKLYGLRLFRLRHFEN